MSINELTLFTREIAWTYDQRNLIALRAKFKSMLTAKEISTTLYHGLNRDIRNRADWLRGRK